MVFRQQGSTPEIFTGIGTDTPAEKLEVVGNVKATEFIGSGTNLTGVLHSETDPSVNALGKSTLSCSPNQIPKWNGSAWICADDAGITSESDPEVGANTTDSLSKWDGSSLVSSRISDDGSVVTVTGNVIADNPTANGHLATKEYVDSAVTASGGGEYYYKVVSHSHNSFPSCGSGWSEIGCARGNGNSVHASTKCLSQNNPTSVSALNCFTNEMVLSYEDSSDTLAYDSWYRTSLGFSPYYVDATKYYGGSSSTWQWGTRHCHTAGCFPPVYTDWGVCGCRMPVDF